MKKIMKKFFILIFAMLIVNVAISQTVGTFSTPYTSSSKDGSTKSKCIILKQNEYIYEYTGTAADTCKGTNLYAKSIHIPLITRALLYNAQVKLKDTLGMVGVVSILGKYNLNDSVWTSITSRTFGGGQIDDTIVNFNAGTTATSYRFYQIRLSNSIPGGTRPLKLLSFGLYLKEY